MLNKKQKKKYTINVQEVKYCCVAEKQMIAQAAI
jgi:hypothetical protein